MFFLQDYQNMTYNFECKRIRPSWAHQVKENLINTPYLAYILTTNPCPDLKQNTQNQEHEVSKIGCKQIWNWKDCRICRSGAWRTWAFSLPSLKLNSCMNWSGIQSEWHLDITSNAKLKHSTTQDHSGLEDGILFLQRHCLKLDC